MVVIIIVNTIAKPYAASIPDDSLKYKTMPIQPANNNQLSEGIYNCPFKSVGYLIRTFGQKFKRMASLIKVKEPLINA